MGGRLGPVERRQQWGKGRKEVGRDEVVGGTVGKRGGKRIRWWKRPDKTQKKEEGQGGRWGGKRHEEWDKLGPVKKETLEQIERT